MIEYLLVIDSLEFKKKDAYKSIYLKSEHYKVKEEFDQQRRILLPGQIKNNYITGPLSSLPLAEKNK